MEKKHLKPFEHIHSAKDQRTTKSIDTASLKNQKITSENSDISYKPKVNKTVSSFNIEELSKEVKTRNHRLMERDKELEKIYKFDSSSSGEKCSPYIKAVVETTPTEKDFHDDISTSIWTSCCKKLCVVF